MAVPSNEPLFSHPSIKIKNQKKGEINMGIRPGMEIMFLTLYLFLFQNGLNRKTHFAGVSATLTPALYSAAIFAAALPWLPEMMAPACPMRFLMGPFALR